MLVGSEQTKVCKKNNFYKHNYFGSNIWYLFQSS